MPAPAASLAAAEQTAAASTTAPGHSARPPLTVLLAAPRGFCAGVDRAIQIVERALERFGAPVYVRHEIVHNRTVVDALRAKGAVFVAELDQVPDDRPVIFSAHGVAKAVPAEARRRGLSFVDATCPLVTKVHREAEQHHRHGRQVVLIGHAGHPEVIGTMGQLPDGAVHLVETLEDVARLTLPPDRPLAYVTQTTLSVDDTAAIVQALTARYPQITAPRKEDICYATTNRQEAVKVIARHCQLMLVLGATNSSNSNRLVEVARSYGAEAAHLLATPEAIDWRWLEGVRVVGLTAGASAPESLVQGVIAALSVRFAVTVEEVRTAEETQVFRLPAALDPPRAAAAASTASTTTA